MSSSVFKTIATDDDLLGIEDTNSYNFDRNGAIIPYSAFVSLMQNQAFTAYLEQIKNKYEEKEGPLTCPEINDVDGEDDDDSENDEEGQFVFNNQEEEAAFHLAVEAENKVAAKVSKSGRKKAKK